MPDLLAPPQGPKGLLQGPIRYFRASPLPHATALGSTVICLFLADIALALHAKQDSLGAVLGLVASGWMGLAAIALLDGFSRYREYRRIRAMLGRYGWNKRVFTLVASSRCQRDAALFAAHETGLGHRAKDFFQNLGYRWYHLFPDPVMDNPFRFFHPRFLRSSFLPGKAPRNNL